MRQYGLIVDLEDPKANENSICINESVANTTLLTESSLEVLFASQTIQFKVWPFVRRFSASLRAQGWPAETFLGAIRSDDMQLMISSTDDEGRTVLHWAAEHLGRCLGPKYNREFTDPNVTRRARGYGDLISKLIRLGADAHAIDANHRSPFLACFFEMINKPRLTSRGIVTDTITLDAAVREWGRAITDSGLSLPRYTTNENRVIGLLQANQRTFGGIGSPIYYVFERLQTQQDADLIAHVSVYDTINVWQFKPHPGAWDQSYYSLTVCLHLLPRIKTYDHHLWRLIESHKVRSGSFPVTRDSHLSWCQTIQDAWKDMMKKAQDDHGPIATMFSRTFALHDTIKLAPKRRRANSYTRSVTPLAVTAPFPDKAAPSVAHTLGSTFLFSDIKMVPIPRLVPQ